MNNLGVVQLVKTENGELFKTSGLALHRVMKPFSWSSAAFGRDAENDMFARSYSARSIFISGEDNS